MARLRRAWRMFTVSLRVLKTRKELVLFPVVSGVASLLVLASFATPLVISDLFHDSTTAAYALLVLGYFVFAYVTVFCQVALVSQADVALRDGVPTVAGGFRTAGRLWSRILPWALLSATVSQLVRSVEDRAPVVVRFVVAMVGAAWSVVTYLVIPILVLERVGVRTALQRSVELVKRTWGTNILGNSGVGVVGFLLGLLAVPIVGLGISSDSSAILTTCIVTAALWLMLVAVLTSALSGIYQTVLYHYAAAGMVPQQYDRAVLADALPPRR